MTSYLHDAKWATQLLRQFGHFVGLLIKDKAAHESSGLLHCQVVEDIVEEQLSQEQLVSPEFNTGSLL